MNGSLVDSSFILFPCAIDPGGVRTRRGIISHGVYTFLDDLAPKGGAFAHALRWAKSLQLPVCGVSVLSGRSHPGHRFRRLASCLGRVGALRTGIQQVGSLDSEVTNDACDAACRSAGVDWQPFVCDDASAGVLFYGHQPGSLWVVSQRFPASARRALVRCFMRRPESSILVCPETVGPMTRALLLNDARFPDGGFLQTATSLCRMLGVSPVVLTVAGSERLAQHATDLARAAVADHGANMLFDCLVGLEVSSAAARIARWRRCQLMIMNRDARPHWWHWLRAPAFTELAEWLPDISLLSVSRATVVDTDGYTISNRAKVIR
jgi:hypothetical protein